MGQAAQDEPVGRQDAPANQEKSGNQAIFEQLSTLFRAELNHVEHLISEKAGSEIAMIPELAEYLISAGGKRLRPLLTLAASALCADIPKGHIQLAAAVEFIHSATLLHDDVVDESDTRRGKITANHVWGNAASVLVGDFLFARAFELMVEAGSLSILDILARASAVIAEGEVLQLAHLHDLDMGESVYYRIIGAKTATLFAAATQVGAMSAGATDIQANKLAEFGREMGYAFQLSDDMLDYFGDSEKLGKSVGDDFSEGKITMPVILAMQQSDESERQFWRQLFSMPERSERDFSLAVERLHQGDFMPELNQMANKHALRAIEHLQDFPPSSLRNLLEQLVLATVNRQH